MRVYDRSGRRERIKIRDRRRSYDDWAGGAETLIVVVEVGLGGRRRGVWLGCTQWVTLSHTRFTHDTVWEKNEVDLGRGRCGCASAALCARDFFGASKEPQS